MATVQEKNRLRVLRAERGWSQQKPPDRAGVSWHAINAVETQRSEPSLSAAFRLAAIFGETIEELLDPER